MQIKILPGLETRSADYFGRTDEQINQRWLGLVVSDQQDWYRPFADDVQRPLRPMFRVFFDSKPQPEIILLVPDFYRLGTGGTHQAHFIKKISNMFRSGIQDMILRRLALRVRGVKHGQRERVYGTYCWRTFQDGQQSVTYMRLTVTWA